MAYKNIVLTDSNPEDYFFEEAIKMLRTNIQFSGKNNKVILLTSCWSGEGKSDISFNLAVHLGKAGKKVLLIDADIRKSVYKTRYNIQEETKGLSQYLSGQIEQIDEVVYRTNYENLFMILSGPYAPNPTEILGDEQFGNLLKAARQVFEYVIIDTPPLGSVVDAAVVGQYCDGAVLVIESGTTSYRFVQKVKNQLEKSGCKILGAVLNKISHEGSAYRRGYRAGYGRYDNRYYKTPYGE
jgi:capsular exopolysaccharide synthesis family protein